MGESPVQTANVMRSPRHLRIGIIAACISGLATFEQLIESGIPFLRARMMGTYSAKIFVQLSIAILCGAIGGYYGRRTYYLLLLIPLLWIVMLAFAFIAGEA